MTHAAVRLLKSLRGWILPALLLGWWECNSHRDAAHAYAFVPLEQVVAALRELLANGDLWLNLKGSLVRASLGLAGGVVLGTGTGVLMAFSGLALTLINPLYQSIRQVPLLGLTPLIGLWLGNGEPAKVFIIALAAFYPMVLSTYEGLRHVDARYLEVGRVFGQSDDGGRNRRAYGHDHRLRGRHHGAGYRHEPAGVSAVRPRPPLAHMNDGVASGT